MASIFRKKSVKLLAILVGIVLVLLFGLYAGFRPISERALRMAGLPDATIERARITPAGSFFDNVQFTLGGNNIQIGRIEAYATFSDFMSLQLTKLVVQDVMVALGKGSAPEASNNTKNALRLPAPLNLRLREASLHNIRTFLPVAEGAPAVFSGSMVDRGEEYQLTGDYEIRGDSMNAAGQISVKAAKKNAAISAHVDIGDARLTWDDPGISLRRGAGWVAIELSPDALAGKSWPNINAQLSAGSLKLYSLPLQGVVITSSVTPEKGEVVLQAQGAEESGDFSGEIKIDRSGGDQDILAALLDAKLKNLDALGIKDLKGRAAAHVKIDAAKPRSAGWMDWRQVSGTASLSAQKLSLPDLMRDIETTAELALRHDPATKTTTLQAAGKPLTLKGVIIPLDAQKPVSLNMPAQTTNPQEILWQAATQRLGLRLGAVDLTTPLVSLKGASAEIVANFSGDQPAITAARIEADELSHSATPPAFVPVKLALQAKTTDAQKGTIGFQGDLTEKNGLLSVHVKGAHELANNKGAAELSIPPTTLTTGVYTLKDIFPMSAQYIQDVTGTIGLNAALAWQKGKDGWQRSTSRGDLFLRDMAGNAEGNIIGGVNGVIRFDSLIPLTLRQQRLAVGSVNVGLPLSNGVVVASLDANNIFTVHQAEWTLAEGKISSSPFALNLNDMSTQATLTATGLQLASLFQIAPMDGLSAQGIVSGTLPLKMQAGEVSIENGVLESTASGFLRYNPQDPPAFLRDSSQQQMIDLQTALRAFEFDSLKLTLNGALGKDQKIGIAVKGKNPEFYNGYPVSLNLNVEGPLENILKYSPGSSQIPDSIKKQMEEYENAHAKR